MAIFSTPRLDLARLHRLWRRHAGRMGRFAVVGLINTGVDVGLFALLFYRLHLGLLTANSLGYATGMANSFVLNKIWTFEDRSAWRRSWPRLLLFIVFNGLGLFWANAIIWLLAKLLPAIVAKCGAVVGVFAWNYWTSHRFVFVPGRPADALATPVPPEESGHVLEP